MTPHLFQAIRLAHNGKDLRKLSHISNRMQTGSILHASIHFCVNQASAKCEHRLHEETLFVQLPASDHLKFFV